MSVYLTNRIISFELSPLAFFMDNTNAVLVHTVVCVLKYLSNIPLSHFSHTYKQALQNLADKCVFSTPQYILQFLFEGRITFA